MKKITSIVVIALAVCTFQACNNASKNSTSAADSANAANDTTKKDTASNKGMAMAVDKDDAKFAVDAANGGMAEVALSKVAVQMSSKKSIKDFADMMITDHTKANNELMALAKSKNITLPDSISNDKKKTLDDLTKKTGNDFDKDYVSIMLDDHKKTVSMFEDAAKNLKDPDLKAFVVKTLPTLKSHLAAINTIHDSMK